MAKQKAEKLYAFVVDGIVQSVAEFDEAPEGWVEVPKGTEPGKEIRK